MLLSRALASKWRLFLLCGWGWGMGASILCIASIFNPLSSTPDSPLLLSPPLQTLRQLPLLSMCGCLSYWGRQDKPHGEARSGHWFPFLLSGYRPGRSCFVPSSPRNPSAGPSSGGSGEITGTWQLSPCLDNRFPPIALRAGSGAGIPGQSAPLPLDSLGQATS